MSGGEGRDAMRMKGLLTMLPALATLAVGAPALAQGEAGHDDPLSGVQVEALGAIAPDAAADRSLAFLRITLPPGSRIAGHSHPGTVIVVVDSGLFATEFTRGEGVVTRLGGAEAAIVPGDEQLLTPGDSLAYDGTAAHTMVNPGDAPLVLLVSALLDPDEPGFVFHDEAATAPD